MHVLRRLRKNLYFKALLFHHCPYPSSKECTGIIQNLNRKFSFIYCMYSHKSKKGLKNDIKPMCRKLLYISNIIKFIVDITEVGMFVMNYIFISCILYMYKYLVMLEHERFDLKTEFNSDLKNVIHWSLIKLLMHIIFFDANCTYIVHVQSIYSYTYIYNTS